jgi:hypothetical protein
LEDEDVKTGGVPEVEKKKRGRKKGKGRELQDLLESQPLTMRRAESTPGYQGALNGNFGVTNNNIGNGAFGSDSHVSLEISESQRGAAPADPRRRNAQRNRADS